MPNDHELAIAEKYFKTKREHQEVFGMFQHEYPDLYPLPLLITEAQKATHAREAYGHCVKLVLHDFICCGFYDCGKIWYEQIKDPEQIKDYFTDEKKLLNAKKRALECMATGQLIEALRGCGDEDIRSAAIFKKGEPVSVNELIIKKLMTILELFGIAEKFKSQQPIERTAYCIFSKKSAYITDGRYSMVIEGRRKLKKLYLAI